MKVLSGDVGGTKTDLLFGEYQDNHLKVIATHRYDSAKFDNLMAMIKEFMSLVDIDSSIVDAACFAVAGPIVDGRVRLTNLPWGIDKYEVAKSLDFSAVELINDFSAIGYGIDALTKEDLHVLQEGQLLSGGIRSIIGAGTGLGVAISAYRDGGYEVYPTEGGHVDFAPTGNVQMELLRYMRKKYSRVSSERLLSGQGLVNTYKYVRANPLYSETENPQLQHEMYQGDKAAAIYKYATDHKDSMAMRALDIFISVYGAQVGNLALMTLPYGGLYIAGGIVSKILPQIISGRFMEMYFDKGRMSALLEKIPMYVILDKQVGLKGAALHGVKKCSSK